MELGEKVKNARIEAKLSKTDLANLSGVSPNRYITSKQANLKIHSLRL